MSFYEDLVMQTQMNYSGYYSVYASGGTPYELSDKKQLPYKEQIEELVRQVKEAECVVVGGASGLSAAGIFIMEILRLTVNISANMRKSMVSKELLTG